MARQLSVANWLKEYDDSLPETLPGPENPVDVAEQDELFTLLVTPSSAKMWIYLLYC